MRHQILQSIVLICLISRSVAQMHRKQKTDNVVAEMQVICQSNAIMLKLNTNTPFNGMVYAKDAPNNSNCMTEFNSSTNMTFRLPLKSCGTLFAEADDGIEYFNTVVVQPHMRLMTNQGKGYHIRCKYQTRERTIANTHFNVSASFLMQNNPATVTTPLLATASMPSCTMKIFRSGRDDVAETVKIGDKLIMVIEIDQQDMYGMKITNCVVRDGLNMAEQQLINDSGCPVDENIMPKFEYTNNSTRAAVSFPAHKFPHTSSVYYQCNVRLCINNGGCEQSDCVASSAGGHGGSSGTSTLGTSGNNSGGPRKKRFIGQDQLSKGRQESSGGAEPEAGPLTASLRAPSNALTDSTDMSFDVYSGLYVSDIDVGESGSSDRNGNQVSAGHRMDELNGVEEYCLSVGQASLVVLASAAGTMLILLMISCQTGFCSYRQQVPSHHGGAMANNLSTSQTALNYNLANRMCNLKQSQARLNQP